LSGRARGFRAGFAYLLDTKTLAAFNAGIGKAFRAFQRVKTLSAALILLRKG
jgi:hypothetical protein